MGLASWLFRRLRGLGLLGLPSGPACGGTVYLDGVLLGGGVAHMGGLCTFVDLGGLRM